MNEFQALSIADAKATVMSVGAATCRFEGTPIVRSNEYKFTDCQLSSGARYKVVVYVESGAISQTTKRYQLNVNTGANELLTVSKTADDGELKSILFEVPVYGSNVFLAYPVL